MKKFLKFLVFWCIPGLLLMPIGGCFTIGAHFMGGSPSTAEAIGYGALDVVTMPVQIIIFGPMAVHELIDANTGERGRLKRRRKDIERIKQELTADFSKVYADPDFLSPSNTVQRDALGEWLGWHSMNCPDRELIDPLAERLLDNQDAAYALMTILGQKNLSPDLKKKLCLSLIEGSRTQAKDQQSNVVNYIFNCKHLSEEELKGLVSDKSDSTDKVIGECLRMSVKARMDRRRREEEEAVRRKVQAEEDRKRELERRRAWERRTAELRELSKNIEAGHEEFVKSLPERGESAVVNYWRWRMHTAANPLPPENVRKLAEVLTEPGEPMSKCCRELFLRPELTEADLRRLYPRVLKKLAEEGEWRDEGWRYAGALIKNPNFPSDLARASYDESLLTELRIVYIFHHVHSRDLAKGELQKFEQECDGLKRECCGGKISLKKSNARRFKLTKKYLPDECPDDWVKSIP